MDPPVLSYQFEEQQRKLDREMMYLINKLKTHPPPKPKTPVNTTKAPLEEVRIHDIVHIHMYVHVPSCTVYIVDTMALSALRLHERVENQSIYVHVP